MNLYAHLQYYHIISMFMKHRGEFQQNANCRCMQIYIYINAEIPLFLFAPEFLSLLSQNLHNFCFLAKIPTLLLYFQPVLFVSNFLLFSVKVNLLASLCENVLGYKMSVCCEINCCQRITIGCLVYLSFHTLKLQVLLKRNDIR